MLKATTIMNYLTLSGVYAATVMGMDKDLCMSVASGCYLALGMLAVKGH